MLVVMEDGGHLVRLLMVGVEVDGAPGCICRAEEVEGRALGDGHHVALGKVGRQLDAFARTDIPHAVGQRQVAAFC